MPSDYDRIKDAILFIAREAPRQPSLEDVAARAGLSPGRLQRLFTAWTGLSPKRFLQFLTATEAKRLLRDSVPVLDASFSLGLSGPGRLHDLIVASEAVTPGEYARYGEGVDIRWGIHETPFGPCLVGLTPRGVCALRFLDGRGPEAPLAELRREWRLAWIERDDQGTAAAAESIFDRARGRPLGLFLKGTNFQLKVWEGLLRIPEGAVLSYGGLAARLGLEGSSRAVAGAVGANPVAYLVPCHRVIRASGALGGYRWGLERKAAMLARESARGASAVGAADAR
jgi:AraC family transcriptional regulator, regulatory protein of adaptative response / methylated-DNA-[protein]-cysteine methyltransferase